MSQPFYIVPMGTSSAIPMHGRHLSATLVVANDRHILIDCGEGTQFRLQKSNFKPGRFGLVLISHMHGDHWFGLPGLLTSLALNGRTAPLQIVGPVALGKVLQSIPGLANDRLTFPLQFTATDSGKGMLRHGDVSIDWLELDHGEFCTGFRLTEDAPEGNLDVARARSLGITDYKDYRKLKSGEAVTTASGELVEPREVVQPGPPPRIFSYVTDTRPCANGLRLAKEANLLLHEATFAEDLQERAKVTGHSTASEAAEIARRAGVHRLLLSHFSARYETPGVLVREATEVFPATEAAVELESYEIDYKWQKA